MFKRKKPLYVWLQIMPELPWDIPLIKCIYLWVLSRQTPFNQQPERYSLKSNEAYNNDFLFLDKENQNAMFIIYCFVTQIIPIFP